MSRCLGDVASYLSVECYGRLCSGVVMSVGVSISMSMMDGIGFGRIGFAADGTHGEELVQVHCR